MKNTLPVIAVLLCLLFSLNSAFANPDIKDEKELAQSRSLETERANNFWKYLISSRENKWFDPYLPLTGGTLTGDVFINGAGASKISLYSNYSGSPGNPGFTIINYAGVLTFQHNSNGGSTNIAGPLTATSAMFGSGATNTPSYMRVVGIESIGTMNGSKGLYLYNNGSVLKLDAYDYGTNTPLDFNLGGNGGTVNVAGALTGTSAAFNSTGKGQLRISSTTPSAKGVGASISLGGNYRTVGDYSEFTRISAEKTNAIDNDYSYNLAFYTTNHGGPTISSVPALVLNHDNTANFSNNVLVGTTQTNSNLYVHGTIKSKEVKVEATVQVPDYVFEKSYDLQPLSEVEKYITENKHLSEIPSAKVIEKEGINVGDMQIGLLKKIEELTLYVIQQNKEAADLRKELEVQSKRAEQQEKLIQEQQRLIGEVQKQIKK